ncbi:MAG: GDP-L-fucose synthase [Eubacterium sp.]
MNYNSKIYIAGHKGLVGSAIVRNLKSKGYKNLITRTHSELDLINQQQVWDFFEQEKPEYLFLAAAKVGGIHANDTYPADFIYENLAIETNVIKAAHDHQVKKLLFLGSTCIYPKNIPQPMKETYLLSGCLEPTNEAYAIAKIAGLEMCKFFKRQYNDNFISCMPTNLYGPHDNFDLNTSHVLPALIRKFHEAKVNGKTEVEVWGTGKPLREFIYVDDMADACVFLMKHYNGEQQINIGTGEEISIANLAKLIGETVGFEGDIVFNPEMKDGMRRKLCDVHKVNRLGWKHQIDLKQGLKKTVQWYLDNQNPVKS